MTEKEKYLIRTAYEEVDRYKEKVQSDPYRLTYHLMPPVGLLNDPNGLIQFKGVYHVFFQWNPFETSHGAKYWGHYSSKDMIHWKAEPIALAPSEWYEINGCYSGSAVESDGKLYLFYTGNVKREDGTRETYQCLAVSADGIHFEKRGPILHLPKGYTSHFRDPKVWKHHNRWYMILGAQTLEETGVAVLFTSSDLFHWEEIGKIAGSSLNGFQEFGYMWECPDLFRLNGKDILMVSPQGLEPIGHLYHNVFQSGYFIGELDYENNKFNHGHFREIDRGFDFYAPQTFQDESGRTILYGWMGITDESESYQPTVSKHWVHALTMPRVLEFKNARVHQHPVEEWKELRKNEVVMDSVHLESDKIQLKGLKGKSIELMLDSLKVEKGNLQIIFRNEASLTYDADKGEIHLRRRNVKTGRKEVRICALPSLSKLQIFLDHSSLEIFINNGEEVFTSRYFPNSEDESIVFSGNGYFHLKKWDLGV